MSARYTIKLSVYDRTGPDEWHMATDSKEFPVFSERFVETIRAPIDLGASLMPFDTVVSAMKERQFRRDYLLEAAKKLAARLADYIEDREGWHGESRRDRIKEIERR